jgi:hypothetical protein
VVLVWRLTFCILFDPPKQKTSNLLS